MRRFLRRIETCGAKRRHKADEAARADQDAPGTALATEGRYHCDRCCGRCRRCRFRYSGAASALYRRQLQAFLQGMQACNSAIEPLVACADPPVLRLLLLPSYTHRPRIGVVHGGVTCCAPAQKNRGHFVWGFQKVDSRPPNRATSTVPPEGLGEIFFAQQKEIIFKRGRGQGNARGVVGGKEKKKNKG